MTQDDREGIGEEMKALIAIVLGMTMIGCATANEDQVIVEPVYQEEVKLPGNMVGLYMYGIQMDHAYCYVINYNNDGTALDCDFTRGKR